MIEAEAAAEEGRQVVKAEGDMLLAAEAADTGGAPMKEQPERRGAAQ